MVSAVSYSPDEIRERLRQVEDPEIPGLSIVDLGVVRDIVWLGEGRDQKLRVAITPTYSGCPAMRLIRDLVREKLGELALAAKFEFEFEVVETLTPPWGSDCITPRGHEQLLQAGIAPPNRSNNHGSGGSGGSGAPSSCPHCKSKNFARVSEFGAAPCKAVYLCEQCLEPFNYFKCL